MTRRILRALAAEVGESARAAFGETVLVAGFLLGLWLILFTPLGVLLAGAL